MSPIHALAAAALAATTLVAVDAAPRASLNLARQVNGHRANVGLLILGHSTSDQGATTRRSWRRRSTPTPPTAATIRCSR